MRSNAVCSPLREAPRSMSNASSNNASSRNASSRHELIGAPLELRMTAPEGPAPRRLCVLLIVPTLDTGAASAGVLGLVRILRQAGHAAVVAAHGGRKAEEVRRAGGTLVSLNVESNNPATVLASSFRLARIIRQHGCDLVHAHGRAAAWSGYFAARMSRRPFLTTWYKGFREQNVLKRFYNSIMVRGERVLVTSDQIGGLIRKRYGACALSVIPWGIDLGHFDPAGVTPARIDAIRRQFGIGEQTKVALVPARILRRKGHHVIVQAVSRLKAAGASDFACVFASEEAGTRYAGELWDQVLATGTADVIRLAGPVEDMPAAYAAATVVVSVAMQADGLPRAILEAQAMARPVIVSELGAGPEALLSPPAVHDDRMTGLRVPAGDPEALAAALIRIFSMPEPARRAVGARGRAWIAGSFNPEKTAADSLRVYAEVCGTTR